MDRVVSFDDEPLILVDHDDREIGVADKATCHAGDGVLHRAFSVFLFDRQGALLLQQRSASKRLWPGIWANSCCSHPRRGETTHDAAERRVREELGVTAAVQHVFGFEYHARFDDSGSEHEYCHVLVGRLTTTPTPNPREVAAMRFVTPAALDQALAANPDLYAPWLHLEWERLRRTHWEMVASLGP